jgi:glycosyltransferase involved in cell wall biosynthesis
MGGSEIVAYEQSRAIKKMGFEIKIFAGKFDNKIKQYKISREKKDFEITRVNLNSIDFDSHSPNFNKEEIQGEFHKDLYQFAPDVVHFHNIYPLSLRMIDECYKMNIPTVMTLHDYWGICFKNTLITDNGRICGKKDNRCLHCQESFYDTDDKPVSLAERNKSFLEFFNKIDLIISPSNYLIKRFIDCGVYPDKTVVINNGIDISRFKKIKKTKTNKVRFGYIGQILEHKGIENILRGLSLLNSKEKNRISLILVGTGEKTFIDYCKGLICELEIANFVKFIGEIENSKVNKIFKNTDVLIVPSIWPENSPVTIMEALATGTPVLASDIGGIPELVQDGFNGYLHRYDDPESLAINIKRFIERPETIKTMGKACLLKAKEHDLVNQVKIIAQHYNRLIERN